MIWNLNRKLERQRRALARPPLVALLRACVGHALLPLAGREISAELIRDAHAVARNGLRELADSGALVYFGIRDGVDLGDPPVALFVLDDGRPPYGKVDVDVGPMVAWVFSGGSSGRGWRAPDRLVLSDLEPRPVYR